MKCLTCFAVFLCFFVPQLTNGEATCPPADIVAPCTCKSVAYGLNVVCANVTGKNMLYSAFRRLSEYNLDSLLLHGINFSQPIASNFFSEMNVDALQLEKSRLIFDGAAFKGLENTLEQLKVLKCSEIGDFEFAPLEKLRELYFSGNKRQRIGNPWIGGKTPNLQILSLDSNEIMEIEEGAFANMNNLREISMADNRIPTISRSIFPLPARSLLRLDLSHNMLSDLPRNIFSGMPSLQNVVLSGNELKTLDAVTWIEVWDQLRSVYLYENSIVCDERMVWIRQRKKPNLFEGTCVEPETMAGKSLREALFTPSS